MEMMVEIEDRLLVRAMEITGITNRDALIKKVVEESIAIYQHRAQQRREDPILWVWGKDDPRWDLSKPGNEKEYVCSLPQK
jgi:hypothetical protein